MKTKNKEIASFLNFDSTCLALLFLCIFLLTTFKIITNDIWYELAHGRHFLEHPSLRFTDVFTFTAYGQPFIDQEWGSEVIFYLLYQLGGINGLIVCKTLLFLAAFGLLFKIIKNNGVSSAIAFWIVFLAIAVSRFRLTVRPDMFSMCFTVIFLYLLESFINGKRKTVFILPILMLIWTNLHYGSIIGLCLIGIYAVSALKDPKAKHLFIVLALCILAALVNPGGINLFTLPLRIAEISLKNNIIECSPPYHFSWTWFPLFWSLLVIYSVIVAVSFKNLKLREILLYGFAVFLVMKMLRFIPYFAVISSIVISRQIPGLLNQPGREGKPAPVYENLFFIGLFSLSLSLGLITSKTGFLERYIFGYGINENKHPMAAIKFLAGHHLDGNIFNENRYGGQIAFMRYPQNKIFMYGRYGSLFQEKYFDEYYAILAAQEGWEERLNTDRVEIILLDRQQSESNLFLALANSPHWHLVYQDALAVIFLKDVPRFKSTIEKYGYRLTFDTGASG